MKPSNIKAIGFKLVGGDASGSVVAHFPTTVQEILALINDAKDFLNWSNARCIEVEMINKEGGKELRTLYKQQQVEEVNPLDVDPFAMQYCR